MSTKLIVGLLSLLVILWLAMYAVPALFVALFDTFLGNILILAFIALAFMYNMNLAIGLTLVFLALWRFSHLGSGFYI
jgi:hypothetical protein